MHHYLVHYVLLQFLFLDRYTQLHKNNEYDSFLQDNKHKKN